MSGNTLKGTNKQGRDKVTVRVPTHLKEQYKEQVSSMSDDLRDHIRQRVEGYDSSQHDTPLQPPDDPELAEAYELLCDLANCNGIVRNSVAKRALSGGRNNLDKESVVYRLLHPLRKRGYLGLRSDLYGDHRAWKLRGWDNGD
jgi:predicted small metal-binding protein